jgi:RHS repeat-associated protein
MTLARVWHTPSAVSRGAASIVATLALLVVPGVASGQETVTYYTTDAIGSVRMVTDSGGAVIARYDYRPFGDPCGTACGAQGTGERKRFTGQEKDAETGFDYVGARYYASGNGRFTTVDPGHVGGDIFNPQSWNAYAYALNNPLRFIDPLGTCSQDAKGNYVDGDDAGTLVTPGPCPRGKDGALTIGLTETVSVKSKPAIVALAEGISVGAGPVADPLFIVGFYGASALVGGAGAAGSIALGSGTLTTLGIGAAPFLPGCAERNRQGCNA